ncbi:MAG: AmpG family muropeptide MFS transporter, partial [Alphaproteobacteria bacterium]
MNTSITAINLSKLYLRPRLLLILVLGFASGLPLLLTGSTLTIRLRESGIDLAAIGLFSLVGIPYSLKFLWAPLIDRLPLPILSRMLGRRRAWMLTVHIVLILAIAVLGLIQPTDTSIWLIAFVALFVAFLSATQDIAIDAYRIEILAEEEYGAGAAMAVYGFRGGMLMSTVGTLYLADYLDWELAYVFTSLTLFVGVIAILLAPRPKDEPTVELPSSLMSLFGETYWKPLVEFSQRDGWVILLLFVLFFKFGDALLSQMTGALFVDLNYDKSTIANVGKLFGFWAMMIGIFIGGLLVALLGLGKTLLVSGLLQGFSNIAFWRLAVIG